MDTNRIMKLYNYRIKDTIKQIVNQTNNILIWSYIFLKSQSMLKLNKITNKIIYSDTNWIAVYPYLYPFGHRCGHKSNNKTL